jgi:ABC-type bacteriocin/lantibiotic exporter with double-glycine peptidase domain
MAEPIRVYNKQALESNSLKQNLFLNIISIKRMFKDNFFTGFLMNSFLKNIEKLQAYKNFHATRWLIQYLLFYIIFVFTFFYGVYQVINKELPLGYLILIQYSFANLMGILIYFFEYYVILINQKEDSKILTAEFEKFVDEEDNFSIKQINDWYDVSLENVNYCTQNSKGEPISILIPDLSFSYQDKIVIKGESGSGKSTLFNILLNQISHTGSYNVNLSAVRKTDFIGKYLELINTTDPFYNMSIEDNLLMGDKVNTNYLNTLSTGLKVKEFLKDMSIEIGHENFNLSSGQLQRLRLFRGLLRNKDIYLLDEAFNGIDPENKREIIEFLQMILRGKTVLQIVHNDEDIIFKNSTYYEIINHTLIKISNGNT